MPAAGRPALGPKRNRLAERPTMVDNGVVYISYLEHRRTRPPGRRTVGGCAWAASLLLHVLVAAAAWAVTAPRRSEPPARIGQTTYVELTVALAPLEISLPEAVEEETTAPVRIMPAVATIARQRFSSESTSVSEPTPIELEWAERIMARPNDAPPTREPSPPAIDREPPRTVTRQAAAPVVPRQPGTIDRPLPELIQSPPPTYPPRAIEQRWEGTVLLRLLVTEEGRVAEVEIIRGSGYGVLDGEAVRAVRGWRFVPAIQDGRSVAASVRLPVRFELSVN